MQARQRQRVSGSKTGDQFPVAPARCHSKVCPAALGRVTLNEFQSWTVSGPPGASGPVVLDGGFQQWLEALHVSLDGRHISRELTISAAIASRQPDQPVRVRWQ